MSLAWMVFVEILVCLEPIPAIARALLAIPSVLMTALAQVPRLTLCVLVLALIDWFRAKKLHSLQKSCSTGWNMRFFLSSKSVCIHRWNLHALRFSVRWLLQLDCLHGLVNSVTGLMTHFDVVRQMQVCS